MPYVDVLWKPDRLAADVLQALVDVLCEVVGETLTAADPEHVVKPGMVDVRVSTVGPHDRIGPDLYITVLARTEPARDRHRVRIAEQITAGVLALDVPSDTLVELVLTNRTSVYDYGD